MSIGSFQHLPGAHEMGGSNALPSEPWLLPISDLAPVSAASTSEAIYAGVRQASRRFWLAANVLCAMLALVLTAQVAIDWNSPVARPSTGGQVADASPPTLAAEKAALTVQH